MIMQGLRKLLGAALSAVLLAGVMTGTSSAAFRDADKITHTQAVNDLVTLGVLNGKADGNFDPSAPVTRAEMCKIIVAVLNGGRVPELEGRGTYSFTDTSGHWARLIIEYCNALGVAGGRGDGTFDPDGSVTAREASKMLLVAAGYETEPEGFTGADWAQAVDRIAMDQGLYTGLDSKKAGELLDRDGAAQMVYNTLPIPMVNYTDPDTGKWPIPRYELGWSLLESKFEREMKDGKMVPIPKED